MGRSDQIILAIDPGLTCGWAVGLGDVKEDSLERYGQEYAGDFLPRLRLMLASGAIDRVVCEAFEIRATGPDTKTTIEIIGAIRWECMSARIPIEFAPASCKAKTIRKARERVNGDHAADAEALRLYYILYGRWTDGIRGW